MEIIRLTRISREGKAVRGMMRVNGRDIATLENADYIIPEGSYPVSVTFSPRFKRMLPLIGNVPGRSGIRIHTGTIPEHSKGCVLMTPKGVEIIKELLTKNEKKDEKTFISIDSRY